MARRRNSKRARNAANSLHNMQKRINTGVKSMQRMNNTRLANVINQRLGEIRFDAGGRNNAQSRAAYRRVEKMVKAYRADTRRAAYYQREMNLFQKTGHYGELSRSIGVPSMRVEARTVKGLPVSQAARTQRAEQALGQLLSGSFYSTIQRFLTPRNLKTGAPIENGGTLLSKTSNRGIVALLDAREMGGYVTGMEAWEAFWSDGIHAEYLQRVIALAQRIARGEIIGEQNITNAVKALYEEMVRAFSRYAEASQFKQAEYMTI